MLFFFFFKYGNESSNEAEGRKRLCGLKEHSLREPGDHDLG